MQAALALGREELQPGPELVTNACRRSPARKSI
jgi:hypothetical protein